jgi:hypothetical protein
MEYTGWCRDGTNAPPAAGLEPARNGGFWRLLRWKCAQEQQIEPQTSAWGGRARGLSVGPEMQVGPCIPVGTHPIQLYKGLELARLLGQLALRLPHLDDGLPAQVEPSHGRAVRDIKGPSPPHVLKYACDHSCY